MTKINAFASTIAIILILSVLLSGCGETQKKRERIEHVPASTGPTEPPSTLGPSSPPPGVIQK